MWIRRIIIPTDDSTSCIRGTLLGTLVVLLTILTIVSATPASSFKATSPSLNTIGTVTTMAPTTTAPTTTAPTTSTPSATTTTIPTTVPGTVSGPTTRPRVGGGCGLSLANQTPSAPVGTCTVLEIGDSLGNDLGWGIKRELNPTSGFNVIQLDKSASGLANTGFYNWPAQLAIYLKKYHPQLVLASFGGDDEQGMKVGGSSVQFATPAWKVAYLARVRQIISEATASGSYVVWVGLPVMKPPYYNQGAQLINSLFQQAVASEANATYISTAALFANPQGAFQSNAFVNGRATPLRQSDGIHYSFAGENVLATYVLCQIALIYHIQLAPTNPSVITQW